MIRILAVFAALACILPAVVPAHAQAPKLPAGADPQNTLVIDTTKGRVVVKLRNDIAPKHAERMKQLARDGYYNNVPFHRVMAGFMAQTGDGQNFNGTGGSKYPNLKAEFSKVSFQRGIVGMARAASEDSANSQFFICFADASFLDTKYTVVGEVVSGMDVVDKLKKAPAGSQSGAVADPDKMLKVQVAADMK
ncbi:MAG TPA: peptidylprolyl isomerase [Xanthobacteraceae bacterium]|nr:peptidylprolyl isomerase [Xanthobacteraceae bacterium]HWM82523.1 peptidylprolyl isomerase [Pseudolabrys sp.]